MKSGGLPDGRTNNGIDPPQVPEFFKIPTLRNIALTAPYMHDGRFKTLEEVVDHYDHGIQDGPFLDMTLTQPGNGNLIPQKLKLTPAQKSSLIAFLKTLTDTELITANRYSNPFQ